MSAGWTGGVSAAAVTVSTGGCGFPFAVAMVGSGRADGEVAGIGNAPAATAASACTPARRACRSSLLLGRELCVGMRIFSPQKGQIPRRPA